MWDGGEEGGRERGREGWLREILPHRDAVGAADKQIPNSSSLNRPCSVESHNRVMVVRGRGCTSLHYFIFYFVH